MKHYISILILTLLMLTSCDDATPNVWVFGDSQTHGAMTLLNGREIGGFRFWDHTCSGCSTEDLLDIASASPAPAPDIAVIAYTGSAQALDMCLTGQTPTLEDAREWAAALDDGIRFLVGRGVTTVYFARGQEGFVPELGPQQCFARGQALGWFAMRERFPGARLIYLTIPGFDPDLWFDAIHPSPEGELLIAVKLVEGLW